MKQNNGRRRFVVLRFVLILLIAAAVGFFGGDGASWLRENVLLGLAGQAGDLGGLAAGALPWVFWGFDLAVTLASLGLYCSARGIFRRWDGEDEEFIDRAERRLCAALILANLLMICGFLLFTLLCAGAGEGFWLGPGGLPVLPAGQHSAHQPDCGADQAPQPGEAGRGAGTPGFRRTGSTAATRGRSR